MTFRLFGRCIDIERGLVRCDRRLFSVTRGGWATGWPWWSIRLPLDVIVTISRVRPKR